MSDLLTVESEHSGAYPTPPDAIAFRLKMNGDRYRVQYLGHTIVGLRFTSAGLEVYLEEDVGKWQRTVTIKSPMGERLFEKVEPDTLEFW